MLDDLIDIAKPRWALLGKEVFNDRGGTNLVNVRALVYGLSAHWKLFLGGIHKEREEIKALAQRLDQFGLTTTGLFITDATYSHEEMKQKLSVFDIVYVPSLKTIPVKLEPRLRSPRTPKQAVEAIVYFSTSVEPFTQDNYYEFLRKTD